MPEAGNSGQWADPAGPPMTAVIPMRVARVEIVWTSTLQYVIRIAPGLPDFGHACPSGRRSGESNATMGLGRVRGRVDLVVCRSGVMRSRFGPERLQ